ncbi:MAG: DUF952 domain-containing protein [Parvularculaceae bacterium]
MVAIYKIMGTRDWAAARASGIVAPAPVDAADGYIHLSTEEQVLETARLHFAGRDDLVAVQFDANDFDGALKWEASRGGALFPHLYAPLPAPKAKIARRLVAAAGGAYAFGEAYHD